MSDKIIPLPIYNFRKPADMLRKIAAEIEKGDHGDNPELAIVLFGKRLHVYAGGEAFGDVAAAAGATGLLLTAGLRQMTDHIVAYEEP